MTTLKKLEARVEALENELGGWRDAEDGWVWDAEEAAKAAHSLESAFDWEECPIQPDAFEGWDELYAWLLDLEEE